MTTDHIPTKDDRGALFRNHRKTTDRHPDYKGEIRVAGTNYWISAWLSEAQSGRKYLALGVRPKEQQQPDSQHKDDDDVGF